MIQLSISFDRHLVRLTNIDINMDIVYLKCQQLERFDSTVGLACQSSEREIVGSNPALGKNFSFCNSFLFTWLIARISQYEWNQL